jgi:hypothetical protein
MLAQQTRRLNIALPQDVVDAIRQQAQTEHRRFRDQAEYLLIQAAREAAISKEATLRG